MRVTHLAPLSSSAIFLGASSPSPSIVPIAVYRKGGVQCLIVSDEPMGASLRFAASHVDPLFGSGGVGYDEKNEECVGSRCDGGRTRPGMHAATQLMEGVLP